MALNLDTRLPLAAVGERLNPAGMLQAFQQARQQQAANEIQQRLNELRLDYENRKRKREADTERYMGEELSAMTSGQPAVERTEYVWQQPRTVTEREAIPARQPTLEDMQQAGITALMRAGDLQGAFEAMKSARAGQVSQMKPFGGETKIGTDGQAYALNQTTGRYEPTGFYPQAAPVKQEKPVQVRTERGIEFVTPTPGMVLKPPVEQPKTEKPMFTPSQLLDLNMKKQNAYKLVNALDSTIAAYREALKGASPVDLANPLSSKRAQIDSLATQLQMAYKNAAELGAITGPDWAIIQRIVDTPGLSALGKGGIGKLMRQLDEVEALSRRDRKLLDEQFSVVPAMPGTEPATKPRSTVPAVGYFKTQKIKTQDQFNAAVRALKAKGWTDAEIRAAAAEAGL